MSINTQVNNALLSLGSVLLPGSKLSVEFEDGEPPLLVLQFDSWEVSEDLPAPTPEAVLVCAKKLVGRVKALVEASENTPKLVAVTGED